MGSSLSLRSAEDPYFNLCGPPGPPLDSAFPRRTTRQKEVVPPPEEAAVPPEEIEMEISGDSSPPAEMARPPDMNSQIEPETEMMPAQETPTPTSTPLLVLDQNHTRENRKRKISQLVEQTFKEVYANLGNAPKKMPPTSVIKLPDKWTFGRVIKPGPRPKKKKPLTKKQIKDANERRQKLKEACKLFVDVLE